MKSKIFDTFLFFNELDLLEIRFETLYEYVDYFIVCECTKTFSGKEKPLYFNENKDRFEKYRNKIISHVVNEYPKDFRNLKKKYFTNYNISYPHKHNGISAINLTDDCKLEIFQRDSIIEGFIDIVKENDIVMYSDIDEIPNPKSILELEELLNDNDIIHFNMKWYIYYLNNFCSNEWFGTRAVKFNYLHNRSIDLIRFDTENRSKIKFGKIIENSGWHFSYLGGYEMVKTKLNSIAYKGNKSTWLVNLINKIYSRRLRKKFEKNQDLTFSNRKYITVKIDNSFPKTILKNLKKYDHLIK